MRILVTGAAGFIGSHLTRALFGKEERMEVVGIDSLDSCYDVSLKESRLKKTEGIARVTGAGWTFVRGDISDSGFVKDVFRRFRPEIVVNLAARAGVRSSISQPDACVRANIDGFYNVLEACRHSRDDAGEGVRHLIYASSSSVYGDNTRMPYGTEARTDSPVSLYAATKKCDEILAYAYSQLYGIPATGLRFFTVYGPEGRPDMAYFKFTDMLRAGRKIRLYNNGSCIRDFTFIEDIVEGLMRVVSRPPEAVAGPPYRLYNLGSGHPVDMLHFVGILRQELVGAGLLPENCSAGMECLPMQPGDVQITCADVTGFETDFGFRPETDLRTGLRRFALWYKDYYLK